MNGYVTINAEEVILVRLAEPAEHLQTCSGTCRKSICLRIECLDNIGRGEVRNIQGNCAEEHLSALAGPHRAPMRPHTVSCVATNSVGRRARISDTVIQTLFLEVLTSSSERSISKIIDMTSRKSVAEGRSKG